MCRIHITGNAGSGKSSLAARVGQALDLPVYSLDTVVWQSGWRKTPADARQSQEDALVAQAHWVIEGVSKRVREAADIVIFLDASRALCFRRCAARNWRYLFRSRPGLPERCPEILIVPYLIKLIWAFPKRVRPRILDDLGKSGKQVYRVQSQSDLRAALNDLKVR